MGMVMSTIKYIFGQGEDIDVPDKIGLTVREKRLIGNSWELVKVNLKPNGVTLFITYFQNYPAAQDYFKSFKGKDLEKIRKSAQMRAHATTVMHALTAMVDNIDDPECLVDLLQKNAANHFARGLTIDQYKDLFGLFPAFLKIVLEDKCDDQTVAAWSKANKVILSVIEEELTKQSNVK